MLRFVAGLAQRCESLWFWKKLYFGSLKKSWYLTRAGQEGVQTVPHLWASIFWGPQFIFFLDPSYYIWLNICAEILYHEMLYGPVVCACLLLDSWGSKFDSHLWRFFGFVSFYSGLISRNNTIIYHKNYKSIYFKNSFLLQYDEFFL
jgi:hypothetical protein